METLGKLPQWAPRVRQEQIRRLYEDDARGMLDEDLLNEVGWALRARCESFLTAVEAARGRAACPSCQTIIPHQRDPDEVLLCPECGWHNTWKAYFATFRHKQLSGAEPLLDHFREYCDRFPRAAAPQAKMLLIDQLIHTFHWYHSMGNTRAAGVNLIEGNLREVIAFLDNLTSGPGSTPEIEQNRAEWRAKQEQVEALWHKHREAKT